MALQGHLESIQEDGLIGGWCWNSADAAARVQLEVLVDNDVVGYTHANVFRADLEAAGIGDGAHAFSFLLPWSAIASKSVCTVRVCEAGTRHPIGGSLTYRRGALIPLEQRMLELERGLRVLQARLTEANERATREANLLRGMLGTIGSFFTQLSEMPTDALSVEGAFGIGALVSHARTQHEPFALASPEAPALILCLTGEGSLAEAYGCLRALHHSGLDAEAEIVLLDTGLSAELALLPSLVQNLRTWRLAPGESAVAVRNRIVQEAGTREAVIFLSPGVRMTAGWLAALRLGFADHPDCAVIASRVRRSDGTVQSSGLLPDRNGRLADVAYAERADVPWFDRVMPVAAASENAVAIRGAAFQALGGLAPDFGEFTASLTDFCLRCWEAGQTVLYQPHCSLGWSETSGLGGFGGAARDLGLAAELTDRWDRTPRPAWPRPVGRALLLDEAAAAGEARILARAETLRRLGYDVTFADTAGLDHEPAAGAALRAMGVAVLRAPMTPSLTGVIETAYPAFALAELSGRAAMVIAPETIRSLSPTTRVVLNLDGEEAGAPLQAAVATSDAVLTGDTTLVGTLGKTKGSGPAVLNLAPRGPDSRRGLWLLLDGEETGQASAEAWLGTLLPAITKALPKLQIHTLRRAGSKLPKGIKQHAPGAADAALFGSLRLALAPFKKPAADRQALADCLAAGLPLVVTAAALGESEPPKGVQTVAGTAQAVTRALRHLTEDDAAWNDLAGSLQHSLEGAPLAAAYRAMLAGLPPVKAR